MKVLHLGPNLPTIYHYMRVHGYKANHSWNEGVEEVIFTKTIHNPQFPVKQSLKGLVVVHKIQINIHLACVQKHWLENRGLPITCWDYIHLLEQLNEESIKFYNETKSWFREGWLRQAIKQLDSKGATATKTTKTTTKVKKAAEDFQKNL